MYTLPDEVIAIFAAQHGVAGRFQLLAHLTDGESRRRARPS